MFEKAVMISIQPRWCGFIANGRKTIEIRKNVPNLELPFKCYIYCTKQTYTSVGKFRMAHNGQICNGFVVGEFVCDQIICFGDVATDPWKYLQGSTHEEHKRIVIQNACLTEDEMLSYRGKYGWHISDLVIYDKPRALSEFMKPCKNDLYCEECAMYNNFHERCGNAALALRRAPQSWCYVRELPREV